MRLTCRLSFLAVVIVSMLFVGHARAIILADNQYRNKSAPAGSLKNSGWQWQGLWGAFTGTPIAKNYFVAASHVGGSVGQTLSLNGKSYTTTAMFDDPNSDLRIWKVSQSFSSWAPLYTGSTEVGKTAVLFGRGTQRGNAVTVNGTTHGWLWGPTDQRLSWGENKIKSTINGGSGIGSVISYSFDRSGHGDHVSNEGIVSSGDSSGGIFVNSGGKWELAGLNYSVEDPFTLHGGSSFNASIFDKGGLAIGSTSYPDGSTDIPQNAYATRISSNMSWINSIIGSNAKIATATLVPEPGSLAILLLGALTMHRRRK